MKPALADQWGTNTEGVASAIEWVMVGRLLAYPVAGPSADRGSRRVGAVIGACLLAVSFVGRVIFPNMAESIKSIAVIVHEN